MMKQKIAHIFQIETEICNDIAKILLENTKIVSILKDDPNSILLLYDDCDIIRGLGNVFKLDAILNIFNNYFVNRKTELKASKLIMNGNICIKFEKFVRLNLVSKVEEKDDIGRDIIDEKYKEIFNVRK